MKGLDVDMIRRCSTEPTVERIASIKVFDAIDSTNSYLMRSPGPVPGMINIAVTSNQTAGRGRRGKTWQSPPGSGLCISIAYTFSTQPENLPALTLALGLGVVDVLQEFGASNVELKWPNDLVALDGKLGGILTEVQKHSGTAVTIVAGLGLNTHLPGDLDFGLESDWARRVTDLKSICDTLPIHEEVAGKVTTKFLQVFADYEAYGFAAIAERWSRHDWLLGREIVVETGQSQLSGRGAGVANDGALLIDIPISGIHRITSGTIIAAGGRELQL